MACYLHFSIQDHCPDQLTIPFCDWLIFLFFDNYFVTGCVKYFNPTIYADAIWVESDQVYQWESLSAHLP